MTLRHPTLGVAASLLLLTGCPGAGTNLGGAPRPSSEVPSRSPSALEGGRSLAAWVGGRRGDAEGVGSAAALDGPGGVEFGPAGQLYVAEAGANRIRRIMPDGRTTVVGGPLATVPDGPLKRPLGVAVRQDGVVIVADTGNHRIVALGPDGTITRLAGDKDRGLVDGAAHTARFHAPFAVALTALEEVIVADFGNHRLRLLERTGQVTSIAGSEAGYVDGAVTEARFNGPADVAVDAAGHAIVADLQNHAIRIVDLVDGQVRTLAGAAGGGDQDGNGKLARFRHPSGVAIDRAGFIYVADAGNAAIKRVSPSGETVTVARLPGGTPTDVAVGTDGTLYVTDTSEHLVLRSR